MRDPAPSIAHGKRCFGSGKPVASRAFAGAFAEFA